MSILQYASPEARYYKYDRDIMEDYDNRINIYNEALQQYQTQAGEYQGLVDTHNELVNQYNADLEAWREKANAYNEAIAAWNQTDRTTPYEEYSGYAPSPGEWVGTAPVFEGGAAPVAPEDPGFSQGDVDAFIKEAQARAVRRGNAGATAQAVMSSPGQVYTVGRENFGSTPEVSLAGMSGFGSSAMGFDEGGIVPPPVPTEEDLARAAAVEDTGRGIGYYIPPELQEKGRQFMNLASALDPAQGIMRGMAASGRAFDESLTPEQRREAGIEAALETLAPAGMIAMGAAAKQPAKAVLMDILTPTGATKDVAEDTLGDPSRRAFLKGAAATAGVAAIAPDIVMEASEAVGKATKAAAKARINPLDMAVANIKELRRQIDEQYDILDEIEGMGVGAERNADLAKDANKNIEIANFEIIDEVFDAIIGLDPEEFSEAVKNIPDDALETLIEPQYESIMGNQRLVDDGENSVRLAEEVKRRGMHLAKDENGIDRFPNARAYFEDFEDPVSARESLLNYRNEVIDNPGNLNMVRETPSDLTQEIDAMRIRNMYRTMEDEILKMRDMGRTEAEIEAYRTSEQARINEAQGLPSDMDDFFAEGGAVGVITPQDLTDMRSKVMEDYGFDPVDVAMEEGVDPELYLRVMYTENRGRQGPVSEAGAIGLMQLMPRTAAELGVDPNIPIENARGGARYLRQQLNTFQSVPLALAAYNAGPGNVTKYGGVPPFEETRNYVAMIHGVDTAEILPNMNDFYIREEGQDPSPKPQLRPEGFGTESYVPPQPVQSEYLMSGIGGVFSGMQQPKQEKQEAPFIPNIMQRPPEEEEARGIEFYKQYAAYEMPG